MNSVIEFFKNMLTGGFVDESYRIEAREQIVANLDDADERGMQASERLLAIDVGWYPKGVM